VPIKDEAAPEGDEMVTHTWQWWYRFARRQLELEQAEAREYADRRALEDLNRQRLAGARAA
jgi:hypothetical protein